MDIHRDTPDSIPYLEKMVHLITWRGTPVSLKGLGKGVPKSEPTFG